MNDAGQIVGKSSTGSGLRGFLYDNGTMIDLGTITGNDSRANAINNQGQIVGIYHDGTSFRSFYYENGVMQDIDDMLVTDGVWHIESAMDINNNSQIVGKGIMHGETHAVMLTPVE